MNTKAIYWGIALGSCFLLSAASGAAKANEKSLPLNQSQSRVNSSFKLTKYQTSQMESPEIVSVQVEGDHVLCTFKEALPATYFVVPVYGDNIGIGEAIKDSAGNITGLSINLNSVASSSESPETIAQNLFIRVVDTDTGIIENFPIENQELSDIFLTVSKLLEVQTPSTGDTVMTGKATPNTPIRISTYVDLDKMEVIAQGQSDANGNFSITLPTTVSGYTSYEIISTGKYGEECKRRVVSQPQKDGENLFSNPDFVNKGEGWITSLTQQEITPSEDPEQGTNFKTTTPTGRMGAVQYKVAEDANVLKVSMDVNVHNLGSDSLHEIALGEVRTDGLIGSFSKEVTLTEADLNQWIHLEYMVPGNLGVVPVGFVTTGISNMEVKNVQLTA